MSKFLIVDNDPVTLKLITDALVNQTLFGKVITDKNIISAGDGLEAFGLLGKYKDINYIITYRVKHLIFSQVSLTNEHRSANFLHAITAAKWLHNKFQKVTVTTQL